MTQSVELLLDPGAEALVRQEWRALHDAGLPSEIRNHLDKNHQPHVTLFAGHEITSSTDEALSGLVSGLTLSVQLGSLMLFGPSRGRYVLVHSLVASVELLELQQAVARTCAAEAGSFFGASRWSPHVTVARRMTVDQLPMALTVLAAVSAVDNPVRMTRCRRWDGTARRSWLL